MVVPLGRIILLFCVQIPNAKYCISFGEHISYTQEISNLKSLASPSTIPGYEKLPHFLDIDNAMSTSHTVVLSAYVLLLSLSLVYQENQAFRIFQEITLHKGGKEKKDKWQQELGYLQVCITSTALGLVPVVEPKSTVRDLLLLGPSREVNGETCMVLGRIHAI